MARKPDTDWEQAFERAIGDQLRRARKRRGWIRRDVVEMLGHEVSMQTLATYEQATRHIGLVRFIKLTDVLDVSALDLLARAFNRVFPDIESTGWTATVDLVAASQLERPELTPLRRWAYSRLASHPHIRRVELDANALRALATLCGINAHDLAQLLPAP